MFKLFSNGCSFLTTRPKDGVDTFTSKIIAEHYGMELYNLAMGGRGNDRLCFTTKHWFETNSKENVFAVIGFSSTHRMDYVTNDGWKKGRISGTELTWRTWKIGEQLRFIDAQPGWDIEQTGTMRWLNHVLDLQNYFENHDIPYVIYNSLPIDIVKNTGDLNALLGRINTRRYFNIKDSHYNYIIKNNQIVSPQDPHPSTDGHKQWAEQLIEFIDVNNLRTAE